MSDKNEIIYGIRPIKNTLEANPKSIQHVLVIDDTSNQRLLDLVEICRQKNIPTQSIDKKTLDKKAHSDKHQGIIAICTMPPAQNEKFLKTLLENLVDQPFLLILDNIQDPHNLGACLRTAEASGVHAVIIPKNNSVGLTSTVRKVASGAAERIPLIEITNLSRTLKWLASQGVWSIGAAGEATDSLFEADLKGPIALVLGNEGQGLRRLTKEHCDLLVKIPMIGKTSSLNVSVATGVCLFEAVRQRNSS